MTSKCQKYNIKHKCWMSAGIKFMMVLAIESSLHKIVENNRTKYWVTNVITNSKAAAGNQNFG